MSQTDEEETSEVSWLDTVADQSGKNIPAIKLFDE